jgi:hypothetical protein
VQEANQGIVDLFRDSLSKICNGRYRIVWDDDPSLDREVVFTTLPVLGTCQSRQVVDWVHKLRVPDDIAIFRGDLNAKSNEPIVGVIEMTVRSTRISRRRTPSAT